MRLLIFSRLQRPGSTGTIPFNAGALKGRRILEAREAGEVI
jgi:hypothetical protein